MFTFMKVMQATATVAVAATALVAAPGVSSPAWACSQGIEPGALIVETHYAPIRGYYYTFKGSAAATSCSISGGYRYLNVQLQRSGEDVTGRAVNFTTAPQRLEFSHPDFNCYTHTATDHTWRIRATVGHATGGTSTRYSTAVGVKCI